MKATQFSRRGAVRRKKEVAVFGQKVIATLTVQYYDVLQALPSPKLKPKDWGGFIEFLEDELADALSTHIYDEIRYLAEIYRERETNQTEESRHA